MFLTMDKNDNFNIITGDVVNAFPHATTMENLYDVAGEDFGERQG